MFMFHARRYLEELERWAPLIAQVCRTASETATSDLDFIRIDARPSRRAPAIRSTMPSWKRPEMRRGALDAGWSDVGSWSALHEASAADENGNVVRGDV